ncbi:MAG TPA: MBL fold metallo-hydrolase [Ktedonobacterales bacterium]|jgi:L-ascorbate metabolism protein UlaG (beta-lactamase superfamily)|nr:MBL fold metallo-hydrolase [Ktedonobacterales bacterium]
MRIQRLNWAGIAIEHGDTTIFIDAMTDVSGWDDMDEAALRAQVVVPQATTIYRYAAITHLHGDHFDTDALQGVLNAQSYLVCEHASAQRANWRGLRVRSVGLYEPLILANSTADLVAFAVPSADRFGDPQVAWVVDGGGRRILHAGDTIWLGHWWNIGRAYGPFDVVFLPINGVTYSLGRNTGSAIPATLTPEQAATAAKLLGAKSVCPIHYGMFHNQTTYREHPDVERSFVAHAEAQGVPVRLMRAGEWLVL